MSAQKTYDERFEEHLKSRQEARNRAHEAVRRADIAARRGNHADAERWTKLAQRLVETAERLEDMPYQPGDGAVIEEMRAELRDRIMRFVHADMLNQHWEEKQRRYNDYVERMREMRAVWAPMPLPPMPYTDEELAAIGAGAKLKPEHEAGSLPAIITD